MTTEIVAINVQTDIVIVGAGLVGIPLCLALSRLGYAVTLIDRETTQVDVSKDSGAETTSNPLHQQCTALSLGSQRWFDCHDLWAGIASDATAIEQVHVSQRGFFGATRMYASEFGVDAVGYVVNNRNMLRSLRTLLSQSDIKHLSNTEFYRLVPGDDNSRDYVTVECKQGDKTIDVHARLLIAADGVTSAVRESLGIAQQHSDYSQFGVLGSIELSDAHAHIAYERFTDAGPLAMLPRGSHHMSFVECISEDDREALQALSDDSYRSHLQSRFGHRLGVIKRVGPRFFTPLVRIEATSQISERTLLLGNAARLLHPIAGQGYNLAIRDIDGLLSLLGNSSESDLQNLGSNSLLQEFVRQRQGDQQAVVRLTDLLARSFRGSASLPSHVRSLGLMGLDAFAPLRQGFARRSMGLW